MSGFENLLTKVTQLQRGFVIVRNDRAAISNLSDPPEFRWLINQTREEFTDFLLKTKGLKFRNYSLSENSEVYVIGDHHNTKEEAVALFSLFSFSGLEPDYQKISAITGVKINEIIVVNESHKSIKSRHSGLTISQLDKSYKKQDLRSQLASIKVKTRKRFTVKPWATITASIALAIVFGTMASSMTSDIQYAEAHLQQADKLLEQGEYGKAIEHYDKVLQIDPNNLRAQQGKILAQTAQEKDPLNLRAQSINELLLNGEKFSIDRQFGKAVIHYREVVNRDPDHVIGLTGLGYAQYNVGQYNDAIKQFNYAVELSQNDINSLNGLGLAYTKINQYEQALKYLNRSIKLDENNVNTLNAFGLFHTKFFEYLLAERYFLASFELENAKIETLNGLATVYYREQNYEDAIALFEQVLDIDDDHRDALFGLGLLHVANGNPDLGQTLFDRVDDIDQNSVESVILEANDLIISGQSTTAISLLNNLLQKDPNNIDALTAKGNAFMTFDPTLALLTFNEVTEKDPIYTNGYVGKINALVVLFRFDEASTVLSELIEIDPDHHLI